MNIWSAGSLIYLSMTTLLLASSRNSSVITDSVSVCSDLYFPPNGDRPFFLEEGLCKGVERYHTSNSVHGASSGFVAADQMPGLRPLHEASWWGLLRALRSRLCVLRLG